MNAPHRPIKLGLLRTGNIPEHCRHIVGADHELFRGLFRDHAVDIVDYAVHRGVTPASLAECDGWLVGGSAASVFDDDSWIRDAEAIVRAAFTEERPIVGVCFGHQLFASALGAGVERSTSGWGIGAHDYHTVAEVPWLTSASGAGTTTLIASHQDQVTSLPDDAVVWSTSAFCPIAGMTIGERAWSMQGHPEFTAEYGSALYAGRVDRLGSDAVVDATATLSRPLSNTVIAQAVVNLIIG